MGGAVKKAVSFVSTVASAVVSPIKKVVQTAVSSVSKVGNWISKKYDQLSTWASDTWNNSWIGKGFDRGLRWIGDKIQWVQDKWNNSWIGKTVNKGVGWVVDTWNNSYIGKCVNSGIRYCADTFNNSWIGKKVNKVVDYLGNSFVGKVFMTILPIVAPVFGAVGVCFSQILGYGMKAINLIRSGNLLNFVSDKINSFGWFQKAKNYVLESPNFQKISNFFGGIKTYAGSFYNTKIQPLLSKFREKGEKLASPLLGKLSGLYEKGKGWISELYQKGKEKFSGLYEKGKGWTSEWIQKGYGLYEKGKEKVLASPIIGKLSGLYEKGKEWASELYGKGKVLASPFVDKFSGFYNKGKERVLASPIMGKLSGFYEKGKELISRAYERVRPYTSSLSAKVNDIISTFRDNKLQATPTISVIPERMPPFHQNPQNTNQIDKASSVDPDAKANRLDLSQISTDISSSFCQSPYIQASALIQQISKVEKQVEKMDSTALLHSYIKKFREVPEEVLKPEELGFRLVTEEGSLQQSVMKGEVKIEDLKFTVIKNIVTQFHELNYQSTIQGQLKLTNNTEKHLRLDHPSGTMYASLVPDTSQHVVTRHQVFELNPKQTQTFNLECYCADSSLHWPQGNEPYGLTQFVRADFTEGQSQYEIWDHTGSRVQAN